MSARSYVIKEHTRILVFSGYHTYILYKRFKTLNYNYRHTYTYYIYICMYICTIYILSRFADARYDNRHILRSFNSHLYARRLVIVLTLCVITSSHWQTYMHISKCWKNLKNNAEYCTPRRMRIAHLSRRGRGMQQIWRQWSCERESENSKTKCQHTYSHVDTQRLRQLTWCHCFLQLLL